MSLLTYRETQVANGKMAGLETKEIARQLGLSTKTIRWYVTRVHHVLSVRNTAEMIREATRLGISPYEFKTKS